MSLTIEETAIRMCAEEWRAAEGRAAARRDHTPMPRPLGYAWRPEICSLLIRHRQDTYQRLSSSQHQALQMIASGNIRPPIHTMPVVVADHFNELSREKMVEIKDGGPVLTEWGRQICNTGVGGIVLDLVPCSGRDP